MRQEREEAWEELMRKVLDDISFIEINKKL